VNSTLASLVALQGLDTLIERARRQLADLPLAERVIDERVAAAAAAVESAHAAVQTAQHSRRDLEKDVAVVDARLARFDEHKAAVKTNQEYTALLHEIAGAKAEKDAIEERILMLLEDLDGLTLAQKTAETALADAKRAGDEERKALAASRLSLEADVDRLGGERAAAVAGVPAALVTKYEQLLKQRRGVAVAAMTGETCTACHVRMRPAVAQQVRRNEEIVQCDSCQRILYFAPQTETSPAGPASSGAGK
jgi:predicted  nucleic acid-binding Zn-ribbon protein